MTRLENGISLLDSKIAVTHDVYINGEYSGKISSNSKVIIDELAVVSGTVVAKDVEIRGKFEGECIVKNQLILHSGCHFVGKFSYGEVITESGSIVKGTFNTITEKTFDDILAQDPTFQHLVAPAEPAALEKKEVRPNVAKKGGNTSFIDTLKKVITK